MKTLCNTVVFALGIVLSAHGVETATVPTLPAPGLIDGESCGYVAAGGPAYSGLRDL